VASAQAVRKRVCLSLKAMVCGFALSSSASGAASRLRQNGKRLG
jgi:hypothetical protein